LQVPVPEQDDGGWNVAPLHDWARPHETDEAACWQPPEPLHRPVLPHTPLAAQLPGSATPLATFAQVPRVLTLQAWHVEQVEVVQQTPSVQWALAHWLSPAHAPPLPFFAVQTAPAQ
jgi:hypothetical protein